LIVRGGCNARDRHDGEGMGESGRACMVVDGEGGDGIGGDPDMVDPRASSRFVSTTPLLAKEDRLKTRPDRDIAERIIDKKTTLLARREREREEINTRKTYQTRLTRIPRLPTQHVPVTVPRREVITSLTAQFARVGFATRRQLRTGRLSGDGLS
jgi:hypothetical protein